MKKEIHSKRVLPLGIIAEGRDCLVVGGGKVATRKVNLLLDAGAKVTVVSPAISSEISDRASRNKIEHIKREFTAQDVNDRFLVFAATDDKAVNRQVIKSCQEGKTLCSSADGNWIHGDFVTPATFRKNELTVSVSTGGRSCRKSRLIKENLARHVGLVESTDLIVLGTSHHQLAVSKREPYHLAGEKLAQAGLMLSQVWGVHEFMILNTCNRIEFIGVVSHSSAINALLMHIMDFNRLKHGEYYIKRGPEAFDHVAILTAGLLSQSPGESNIVGQIKEALDRAVEPGWANGMMKEWISSALHISKTIRQKTEPLLRRMEIEDICIEYLRTHIKKISGLKATVIGTGAVGNAVVRGILKLNDNAKCDWIYHHHKPEMTDSMKSRVNIHSLDDMQDLLKNTNVIVCAISSPDPILKKEHAGRFNPERKTIIFDLAVPRNVDPELNHAANVAVIGLDELKGWHVEQVVDMNKIMELSHVTLHEHKEYYAKIINSFHSGNKSE